MSSNPFYYWVTDTQFGSGVAKAIARRIDASGGGSQSWPLDYDEMAADLEFTAPEIHTAVALLISNGHARIEIDAPGYEGAWLLLLTPERIAEDADRAKRERAKAEARAAKIALRGGRINRTAIPKQVRDAVYERDGRTCQACGATDDLALDHIYPWSLGGPDSENNLQVLCRPCNSSKGDSVQHAKPVSS